MDKARKQLFAAFDDKDKDDAWSDALVQLVQRHNARDNPFKLEEFLESLSEKDQAKLWEGVAAHISPLTEAVALAGEEEEEEEEGKSSGGAATHKDACASARILQAAVAVAQTSLNVSKKGSQLSPGLLQCMMALHDVLFQLSGVDGEALQAQIAKVCEQWWKEERGGAEYLVPQLLPYMVARSLEEDAKEAMVKRVYALRGALLLLDYDDEATDAFKLLLLQCFLKPTYLRSADGRRLLTYLFGLHPDLIPDIHATVKNQLPRAGKRVVQAYGDVYFRAWKAATGPYLQRIEQDCVQDLMHCAVACSCPSLYCNLRLMLQSFHANKRLKEVDAMLLRLYNPIIWRSLQVANPVVRAQATGLLVDAFPLQNPDAGTVEVNALLQKQLDMLQTLLLDPDPRVRVAAVAGVCRIMAVYWEAIPLHVTQAYITRLVGSLAMDGSSALVRQAVVEGLATLLDNPLSHPVLRSALPLAAPLLHDKAERVRGAFLTLLNKVKGVRDIKFYHIVQVDQLLNRFSEDAKSGSVSSKMVALLLNSYFPQGPTVTGAKQVSRCLTFLRQSKGAALAFYSRLRDHVSLSTVVKLTAMLLRCVFTAALKDKAAAQSKAGKGGGDAKGKGDRKRPRENKKGGQQEDDDNDEEEEEEEEEDSAALESGTLEGILEVARVLWSSVAVELQEAGNKAISNALLETLQGQDVVGLYGRLDDVRPLLGLACLAPGPFIPLLAPMGEDLLRGGAAEGDEEGSSSRDGVLGAITTTLCAWGKTSEVIELLSASLEVAGTSAAASKGGSSSRGAAAATSSKESKRKRGSAGGPSLASLTDGGLLPPETALSMLDHLLRGESDEAARVRDEELLDEDEEEQEGGALLSRVRAALHKARDALHKRVVAGKAIEQQGTATRRVLVGCVEALFRLELHAWGASALAAAGSSGPRPLSKPMQDCLRWLDTAILPAAMLQMDGQQQQGGGGDSSNSLLMSPLSPPPRKAKTTTGTSSQKEAAARAMLAQEVLSVCLTVVGDWVVCGVALAEVTEACQAWAEAFLLPALRGGSDEDSDDFASRRREMVLATMPQVCKLAYQLAALQESRGSSSARLPAALLEVVIQSADFHPKPEPQHRYHDSGVDSAACLSALLQLYSRSKGSSAAAALSALTDRMVAPIVLANNNNGQQQEEEEGGRLVPVSDALCSVLAKSPPGLNAVVMPVLNDVKDYTQALLSSSSSDNNNNNQQPVRERLALVVKLLEAATAAKAEGGSKARGAAAAGGGGGVVMTRVGEEGCRCGWREGIDDDDGGGGGGGGGGCGVFKQVLKSVQEAQRSVRRIRQLQSQDDDDDDDGGKEEGVVGWAKTLDGISARLQALTTTTTTTPMDEDDDNEPN